MPLIKPISKLSKTDIARTGGKGASLGELAQAGMPTVEKINQKLNYDLSLFTSVMFAFLRSLHRFILIWITQF